MKNKKETVLFWDFHGTLTMPDFNWFGAVKEAAAEQAPQTPLQDDCLHAQLTGSCLPWFTIPSRDTRHVAGSAAWWEHTQQEFVKLYVLCGLSAPQAQLAAKHVRRKILQPKRYVLYPDALTVLAATQKAGYKNYLLSNNFPELGEITAALGLAPYFAGEVISGIVGYDKPHKEIFNIALQLAGGPANPVMIGDNPEDDIVGGNKAGFTTIVVHGVPAKTASYSVDALADILPLLGLV